jgi:hypothetical protein
LIIKFDTGFYKIFETRILGTVEQAGLFCVNPFISRRRIDIKNQTSIVENVEVLDENGMFLCVSSLCKFILSSIWLHDRSTSSYICLPRVARGFSLQGRDGTDSDCTSPLAAARCAGSDSTHRALVPIDGL